MLHNPAFAGLSRSAHTTMVECYEKFSSGDVQKTPITRNYIMVDPTHSKELAYLEYVFSIPWL